MIINIIARPLGNGNSALYLDYHHKNFRKKEALNLFLIPDDAPNASRLNNAVLERAQLIRAERLLHPELLVTEDTKRSNGAANSGSDKTWMQWCDEYLEYSRCCNNCKKMLAQKEILNRRIKSFLQRVLKRPGIMLKDVDKDVITEFFHYMKRQRIIYSNRRGGHLAPYTLWLTEEMVRAMFNKAIREELITVNPVSQLPKAEHFRAPDKHREVLTIRELKRFLAVETSSDSERMVQLAFGFACMTGLRISDVRRLRWCDIRKINGVEMLTIVQQKTKGVVSVPLNELALSLMPPKDPEGDGFVFHLVKKADNITKYVKRIAAKAGITKDFKFHSSRHTAATLALNAGAELYTISKILGHKDMRSTQVYAKVNIKKKAEAVNLTNGVFH